MYEYGIGVPQDYKEAVKWYRLAAEQGDASAQFYLGRMFEEGNGVPKDNKEAVKWWKLSAEQDDAKAQYKLGLMYKAGYGVPQDYVLAHMWYNLAGSNGHEDARENKKRVEDQMTPQQIEKAQEMAKNWKPKK